MGKRYQVVGAVAILTQDDGVTGVQKRHLHKGAVVGPGATDAEIAHHLDMKLIAEVPGDAPAGVDAAGEPVVGDQRTVGAGEPGEFFNRLNPDEGQVPATAPEEDFTLADDERDSDADAEPAKADDAEAKRVEARAKLPADGSAPDGRAGKTVWVEYAVAAGYDRATMEAADKADIVALFKP